MGEKVLETWCASRGIAATRPGKDEHGWDYLLESPDKKNDEIINLSVVTKAITPIKCVVQVKSTDGNEGRVKIKLKNWEGLAVNWPLPAFFLVLEFSGKDSPESAYLVHVGRKLIYRILERRRKVQAGPSSVAQEPVMYLSYGDEHRLESVDGTGLERAIANHVVSPEEYFRWKMDYIQSVGYENGRWMFSVKPPTKVSTQSNYLDYIVNLALGLESPLQISELEIYDRRFDIPIKDSPFPDDGELEIVPHPAGKAQIQFRKRLHQVTFEADAFLPIGVDLSENQELMRTRLTRPFLDMVITPFRAKGTRMNIRWPDIQERVPLKELKVLSDIFLMMKPPVAPIVMKIGIDLYNPPEPGHSKLALPKGTLDPFSVNESVFQVTDCIGNASVVAAAFNLLDTANVRLSELMHVEERLRIMSSLMSPGGRRMRIKSSPKTPDDSFLGKSVCTPVVFGVRLGDYGLLAGFSAWGKALDSGEVDSIGRMIYEITTSRIELSRKICFQGDENIDVTPADVVCDIIEEVEAKDSSVTCIKILDWYDQEPKETKQLSKGAEPDS